MQADASTTLEVFKRLVWQTLGVHPGNAQLFLRCAQGPRVAMWWQPRGSGVVGAARAAGCGAERRRGAGLAGQGRPCNRALAQGVAGPLLPSLAPLTPCPAADRHVCPLCRRRPFSFFPVQGRGADSWRRRHAGTVRGLPRRHHQSGGCRRRRAAVCGAVVAPARGVLLPLLAGPLAPCVHSWSSRQLVAAVSCCTRLPVCA